MPGGDRTGPRGMGPMTGRAAGYCAGYGVPGFMNPGVGRGFWGWGRGGGGWGRRNRFYAGGWGGYGPPFMAAVPYGAFGAYGAFGGPFAAPLNPTATAEQELEHLKGQADYFAEALSGIKKRIEELEASSKEK